MIVQSVITPKQVCDVQDLYFHTEGDVGFDEDEIIMEPDSYLDSNTYMNLFDVATWEKYTGIKKWMLQIYVSGKGNIKLWAETYANPPQLIESISFNNNDVCINIPFEKSENSQYIFIEINACKVARISSIKYLVDDKDALKKDIHLGIVICTYKRNKEVQRNVEQLKNSKFFDVDNVLYGKMSIRIVDNASELQQIQDKYIKIYYNPNTGGSGGFTRGILETRKDEDKYKITHVVLMDDDVEFVMESFYRLYALLTYMKMDYEKEAIAGRMFRTDQRGVQYTAAEIWNAGDIKHIGWNADMTDAKSLFLVNDNTNAEYGGWWYCCYPMEFVRVNDPLPFFIHCDDVEYGLRHGGTPIILNGIQVWHETYECRQSPVIAYYDTRNPLIVNTMYGVLPEKEKLLADWKRKITEQHVKEDYITERMIILGMFDFITGSLRISDKKVMNKHHKLLLKGKFIKIRNALFWRLTEKLISENYYKMKERYSGEK